MSLTAKPSDSKSVSSRTSYGTLSVFDRRTNKNFVSLGQRDTLVKHVDDVNFLGFTLHKLNCLTVLCVRTSYLVIKEHVATFSRYLYIRKKKTFSFRKKGRHSSFATTRDKVNFVLFTRR